jgi:arylsulfatase A-like enzyme
LITADQWSGRLLGAAGHPCIMTTTLDKLAGNGVRYTRAYSATPMCIPARRALMTGATAQTHGDRVFDETLPMPGLPTLARTFFDAGYQTYAVGKVHVYPQRDRIGFGDVILNEEGRHHLGMGADDYELFLAAQGYAGQEYGHGMGTNDYVTRPWHLPEALHHTNWTTQQMSLAIKRRDPARPAFWYLSYNFPHPPVVPLAAYLGLYDDVEIPRPVMGEWAQAFEALPYVLKKKFDIWPGFSRAELKRARQGFYAQCTHIDHQLRLIIGILQEEGLLDNTILCFTSDHGDMLGDHGLFAKSLFYEESTHIPMILIPTADYRHLGHHQVDDRLVELRDVMPTLLEMAGVPVPGTVEGLSLLSGQRRDHLYGEAFEGVGATRMILDERYKLIYYAAGNRCHLFDLQSDPDELHDLAGDAAHAEVQARLTAQLVEHLYGSDVDWIADGRLVGLPAPPYTPGPDRGLIAQRGLRFM